MGISAFSFGIFEYGIGFMLLHATHSPLSFGLNLSIAPIMGILFFIPVGNFVDHHDHKAIILWSYIFRLIAFALLAMALPMFNGMGLFVPVAIFVAVDSLLQNIRSVAYSASYRQMVNKDYIAKISSLLTATSSASRILAPVLGVALYAALSIEWLISIVVAATVIAMLVMLVIRFQPIEKKSVVKNEDNGSQLEQFKATLKYMRKRPFVRDTIIAEVVVNFFYTASVTGIPFIVVNQLHLSNKTVAIIEMGSSIGYLVGSLLIGFLRGNRHFARKILLSMVVVGLAIIGSGGLFMLTRDELVIALIGMCFSALMEGAFAIFDLAIEIRLQNTVEQHILGRVSSTLYTASFAIMPVGTMVFSGLFGMIANGSILFVVSGLVVIGYVISVYKLFKQDVIKDDQYVKAHRDQI